MAESKRNRNKDKENYIYKRPQNGQYMIKASTAWRQYMIECSRHCRTWCGLK
jgi:hypothetical protein